MVWNNHSCTLWKAGCPMNDIVGAGNDLGRPGEEGGRAGGFKTDDRAKKSNFKFGVGPDGPTTAGGDQEQNDLLGEVYRVVAEHQLGCQDWPNRKWAWFLRGFSGLMIKLFGLEIPV